MQSFQRCKEARESMVRPQGKTILPGIGVINAIDDNERIKIDLEDHWLNPQQIEMLADELEEFLESLWPEAFVENYGLLVGYQCQECQDRFYTREAVQRHWKDRGHIKICEVYSGRPPMVGNVIRFA